MKTKKLKDIKTGDMITLNNGLRYGVEVTDDVIRPLPEYVGWDRDTGRYNGDKGFDIAKVESPE